ncbi:MAG: MFS transporter [Enterobacter cloacae]|nr:MFS transporter [Enterobacter cloacae]
MHYKIILFYAVSRAVSLFSMLLLPLWYATNYTNVQYSSYLMMEYIPFIILGVVSGHYIDTSDLKKLSRSLVTIQFFASLVFIYALYSKSSINFYTHISIFLLSSCSYTTWGVINKISHLSLQKESYNKFNSLVDLTERCLEVSIPFILGFMLVYSLSIFTATYLALSLLCLLSYYAVDDLIPEKESSNRHRFFLNNLKNGLKLFFDNKQLLSLSLLIMFINAIEIMPAVILPIYAKSSLSLDSVGLSSIYTTGAIGAIVGGGIAFKFLGKNAYIFFALLISLFINAMIYFALYYAGTTRLLFISFFFESMSISISAIAFRTLRQHYLDSSCFGLMVGISGSMIKLLLPLAIILSGLISQIYGSSIVYFISGFLELAIILPFLLFMKFEKRVLNFE